jgi:hypothetical protein
VHTSLVKQLAMQRERERDVMVGEVGGVMKWVKSAIHGVKCTCKGQGSKGGLVMTHDS